MIANVFVEGSYCDRTYQQMLDAYSSICRRLNQGEWNDPDVEVIINSLLSIGKHLSLEMFDYGMLLANSSTRASEKNGRSFAPIGCCAVSKCCPLVRMTGF